MDETEEREHLALACRISGIEVADQRLPLSKRLDVAGIRLHYVDWGGDGPPILFLHGGCLTARTWDVVCLALRAHYHCIALDLRGHGESEWPAQPDYAFDALVGDVERFVDAVSLDHFAIVGQSLGGATAMAYGGRHSDRLAAIVLVDVGPSFRKAGSEEIRDFVSGGPRESSLEDFIERAIAFNPLRDPRLLRRSLLYNLKRLANGLWTWKYDPRIPARFAVDDMETKMRALWDTVRRIECPALVVRGALSRVLLDEDAATLAAALPDGHWCRIEGAGHNVQGDNPKALAEAISDLMTRIRHGHDDEGRRHGCRT